MVYTTEYPSPLGTITLACDEEAIIGLWFNGQRYFGNILPGRPSGRSGRCSRRPGAGWTFISPAASQITCRPCGMTPPPSAGRSARSC